MDNHGEMFIYRTEDGSTKIDVNMQGETVWLTQEQMAALFQRNKSTISRHIKNIFSEGELDEKVVVAEFATTSRHGAMEGKTQSNRTRFYNLDTVISVGYRVKSPRGAQFRMWATNILKEYIKKGFAMDDERLKELGGGGYFKELLSRIRDIRASEKVFYRQVLEIYATSIDYDPTAEVSIQFFKRVQNKIHYAISGETAAEVVYHRADAEKDFMGLMTFSGEQPTLREAKIAKNYLDEKELRAMGQLVSGYLDFAERQAEREIPMMMEDWAKHLDGILTSTGEPLLIKRSIELAKFFGVSVITTSGPNAKRVPAGFDWQNVGYARYIDFLRSFAAECAQNGISIALEPICRKEYGYVNTVAQAVEIIKEVGKANLSLLVDIFHSSLEGEDFSKLEAYAQNGLLTQLHAATLPERMVPMLKDADALARILRPLVQAGFNGRVSIEANTADWKSSVPEGAEAVRRALAAV